MFGRAMATTARSKINNSYESEPSTGSGSSLSENNEGHISDDEHMGLPYLMKPKSLNLDGEKEKMSQQHSVASSSHKPSSQETSQFLGFGDSPYGQVNKRLYGSQLANLKLPEPQPTEQKHQSESGRNVFPRFYDTVIEENSCNAVDMAETINITPASITLTGSLSFDGKIRSLTDENKSSVCASTSTISPHPSNHRLSTVSEASLNTSQKFHNERSPDLFANSDDDDYEDGDQDDEDKGLGSTLEDLPEVLEESIIGDQPRSSLNAVPESTLGGDPTLDTSATTQSMNTSSDPRSHFLENCRRERELYRRTLRCLQGVRPPPSVTTPEIDIIAIVVSKKSQVLNFLTALTSSIPSPPSIEDSGISMTPTIFKPTHTLVEAQQMGWGEVLGVRHHGLSYNLNKAAEQNEYLSMSVVDRYVGVETATSYLRSPSSAKKRNMRMKMLTQSPGDRLSHLAKRRAVFSSANLATNSMKLTNSIGPQIMLDKKNARNKRKATPKRKTPGSKKKLRKTPSSSARKRLHSKDLIKPGPSRETSKRALFQSPAKTLPEKLLMPTKPLFKPEMANRVEKSKRALFSPDHQAGSHQLESLLKRKRNACDEDDANELASQSSKLFRANKNGSNGLTPRALKIKSQSFCIGAGTSTSAARAETAGQIILAQKSVFNQSASKTRYSGSSLNLASSSSIGCGMPLQRAQSDISGSNSSSMTDNQRKKLLWAVSLALQERKITAKHENFRQHAAVLARIVKRIFLEFYLGHSTSNNETLLRLAKKFAYHVVAGKQADEIYIQARSQESEAKRASSTRLSGYIGPEEYAQRKLLLSSQSASSSQQSLPQRGSIHNLFGSEISIESFGLSQMSQPNVCSDTQSSLIDRISDDIFSSKQQQHHQLPILSNPSLQNSSSKSNLGALALRENVDCEQRRSAQKNFTGKDQRNISPYYGGGGGSSNNGSARKFPPVTATSSINSGVKAKRQISFDN